MAYAGGLNIIVLSFLLKFKFLHIEIMLLDKELFVKITPFGLLVVPDVKIINLSVF